MKPAVLAARPATFTILHLGLGAFHRAHQAAYLQALIEAGDTRWSIAGANLRPDLEPVLDALRAQDGCYTLETIAPDGDRQYQCISALHAVLPYTPSHDAVVACGADPRTRIVSFTVTEAGYALGVDDRLDTGAADIAADLSAARLGGAGRTIYGALCAILRARRAAGAGPLTLLCCDNLRHNGARVRRALLEFIEHTGDTALGAWVQAHTTCPNGMVDRITPRPPAGLRARVQAATGWDDAAPVTAERFIQWVVEDDFIAGRPDWGRVGVQLVDDVAPFEEAKIRILNASHSAIAWAGTLHGLQFIHEGTQVPAIRRIAHDYVTDDVIACLHTPAHPSPVDLPAYRDTVLERFGNAALMDTNQRVAMDGFSKIPGFIAPTVRQRLAHGEPIDSVAMLPALFLAFLQRWHAGSLPYRYDDQAMDPAVAHAICSAADPVAALCADRTLWGDTAGDARLVGAVRAASARVQAFAAEAVR